MSKTLAKKKKEALITDNWELRLKLATGHQGISLLVDASLNPNIRCQDSFAYNQ